MRERASEGKKHPTKRNGLVEKKTFSKKRQEIPNGGNPELGKTKKTSTTEGKKDQQEGAPQQGREKKNQCFGAKWKKEARPRTVKNSPKKKKIQKEGKSTPKRKPASHPWGGEQRNYKNFFTSLKNCSVSKRFPQRRTAIKKRGTNCPQNAQWSPRSRRHSRQEGSGPSPIILSQIALSNRGKKECQREFGRESFGRGKETKILKGGPSLKTAIKEFSPEGEGVNVTKKHLRKRKTGTPRKWSPNQKGTHS